MYRGLWNDTIPVAVKFVLTSDTNGTNADNYKQLAKEIAILRECRNSNIVLFYGACLRAPAPPGEPAPHALMLVTEYMPLGDLFAALQGPRGMEYRWQNKYACCCGMHRVIDTACVSVLATLSCAVYVLHTYMQYPHLLCVPGAVLSRWTLLVGFPTCTRAASRILTSSHPTSC